MSQSLGKRSTQARSNSDLEENIVGDPTSKQDMVYMYSSKRPNKKYKQVAISPGSNLPRFNGSSESENEDDISEDEYVPHRVTKNKKKGTKKKKIVTKTSCSDSSCSDSDSADSDDCEDYEVYVPPHDNITYSQDSNNPTKKYYLEKAKTKDKNECMRCNHDIAQGFIAICCKTFSKKKKITTRSYHAECFARYPPSMVSSKNIKWDDDNQIGKKTTVLTMKKYVLQCFD
jgi:hypothetical protein